MQFIGTEFMVTCCAKMMPQQARDDQHDVAMQAKGSRACFCVDMTSLFQLLSK
jgi:hypothetical protein